MKYSLAFTFAILFFAFAVPGNVWAQSRDFLTDDEIELVRDAQEIDRRIDVLVAAMDRRFKILSIDVSAPDKKEKSEWGPLPKGSRLELLLDLRRLLQKASDDIDGLAERPDSAILPDPEVRKPKSFQELFGIAVRDLAAAATRFKPALNAELTNSKEPKETGLLQAMIENCDAIIDSVSKLPAVVKKSKK